MSGPSLTMVSPVLEQSAFASARTDGLNRPARSPPALLLSAHRESAEARRLSYFFGGRPPGDRLLSPRSRKRALATRRAVGASAPDVERSAVARAIPAA